MEENTKETFRGIAREQVIDRVEETKNEEEIRRKVRGTPIELTIRSKAGILQLEFCILIGLTRYVPESILQRRHRFNFYVGNIGKKMPMIFEASIFETSADSST